MDLAVLGWSPAGPRLRLDHETFAYAGQFATGRTGVATASECGTVLAAASFDPDRTDAWTLVVRYLTVRRDRQGEGIGPRLLRFVADRARERGFGSVRISVNNPFAYEACYRAGFAFTGEETGMAELVLVDARGRDRSADAYRRGLAAFAEKELPPGAGAFVERHRGGEPSDPVAGRD